MNFRRLSLAALFATTLLTGCGSGSSGGTQATETPSSSVDNATANQNKLMVIKGIAAFGVPMRGAAVTIIGRNSKGAIDTSVTGTATGEDGSFSISVPASWQAPILLEATANVSDRVVVLHSILGNDFEANTSTQTINITPFTEALFASVVGQQPSSFYSSVKSVGDPSVLAALTKQVVDAKHNALRAAIAPLLATAMKPNRPDNINLISTPFSANHTGMDKALDMTSLYYSSDRAKLQLTNKVAPTAGVTVDLASKNITGSMPDQLADTIETINSLANDLTTLYKNGVPTSAALAPYIASSYVNDSTDATNLKSVLSSSDYAQAGFSLNNINAIYQDSSGNYRYDVLFKIQKTNQTTEYQSTTIAKTAQGWQFVGNGHAALSTILSFYSKNYDLNGNPLAAEPSTAGLILRIEQPKPGNWFDKATITGPGINGSVTLFKSNLTKDSNGVTTGCTVLSLSPNTCQTRFKFDRSKESDFNEDFGYVYSVALYRNAADATPYQQYTLRIPIKPYLSADAVPTQIALTSSYVTDKNAGTTATSPTLATLASFSSGELPVYWNKVLAYDTGYVYSINLDVDVCLAGQLKTFQAVTYGDYADSAQNRTITFSTDITVEKPERPYLRVFPSMAGLEPNIVRRDLRLSAQDENNRVYYTSYSNALSAACQ